MIDEKILDEIMPVPSLEALRDEKIAELEAEGFVITNFSSGGIFYHLLMIICKIRIELIGLLRGVLNDVFVSHARGTWLELKGADFSKKRKQPTKATGYVTVSREQPGEAVKIPKHTIFKTLRDINGEELRYFTTEAAVLQKDVLATAIVVEAEKAGAEYNVPPGHIARSLVHLEGIDRIDNGEGWIIREGADIEDYESFRRRTLGAWAELAERTTAEKFKNVCEGVEGVLYVNVDDRHPRGQGTVDIIVTGTAGEATEALLEEVRIAADEIRGPYDNLLVKSSVTVTQDIAVTVTVSALLETEGLEEKVASAIAEMLQISSTRNLGELIHADIIHTLRSRFDAIRNVKVTLPTQDVELDSGKVLLPGRIDVTVLRQ